MAARFDFGLFTAVVPSASYVHKSGAPWWGVALFLWKRALSAADVVAFYFAYGEGAFEQKGDMAGVRGYPGVHVGR